ncbi:hypothetical protein GJ496_005495 [Pomphorhynchus laevis]|nr:hypothetical protein GJ496_005288 [Pomphorhynchus laevis]KAI0985859.1 hypothetical protein GJ496_005495 [Pomphorhynchus laevis]
MKTVLQTRVLNNKVIQDYINMQPNIKTNNNLSKSEMKSLRELQGMNYVIFQQSDKRGKIVICPKNDYLSEGLRQLKTDAYEQKSSADHASFLEEVKSAIRKHFSHSALSSILVQDPRPGYL